MTKQLLNDIEHAFEHNLTKKNLVEEFLNALESGTIRCAQKNSSGWVIDERIKKGILLAFRLGKNKKITSGPFSFIDKDNLPPQEIDEDKNIRIVPGGSSVRRGAFLGKKVCVMPPSYINIGAYVDDETMVDSNALIGSCAQIGKRVHISAGAQIGGVLEPIGAYPVIIEDDCMIAGNVGIYEGTLIGAGTVIGAGVVLTKSSKVFDLVKERVITADDNGLEIPPHAVVVPGSRLLPGDFAQTHKLAIASPLIVKYRDHKTDSKIKRENSLR